MESNRIKQGEANETKEKRRGGGRRRRRKRPTPSK